MSWDGRIGVGWASALAHPWVPYGLAVLLPFLTTRLIPGPYPSTIGTAATAFAVQILICSLLGGVVPGLLCTLMAALLADYYLIQPGNSFAITVAPAFAQTLGLLLTAGILLSLLGFVLRDSVRRHRTESALEQSELRFRQMAETVNEVFWLSTPDANTILYVSPAFETIWGHSCEALYRDPNLWSAAIHPQDVALVRKSLDGLARGNEYDVDFRIRLPDGTERWINDRGYVRRGPDGKVILTSGIATDITQRRWIAESLQTSERRLTGIVSSTMDGIITIDDSQRITFVNFATEAMFACSATKMVGRPLIEFLPERSRARHVAHVEGFGQSGDTQRTMGRLGVVHGLRADGTEFPVEASISQVELDGRKYYTAIFRDVTQRLEHERRIARLTRIYSVLSAINSMIVRATDRQQLFEEACRILVELGEFPTAWIGLMDEQGLRVAPAAWRGPETDRDLVFDVEFVVGESDPAGGSTVDRAIRERRPVYSNDLRTEVDPRPILQRMIERGYRSIIALPLLAGDRCLGVLALHSRETGTFDEQEEALLVELAGDIAFSLGYIRKEEELNYLAYHDPLTGLANRAMLHHHLTQVISDSATKHQTFAVLLMNINNFRDINDTLGHRNGDVLLNAIAGRISESLWESDIVACLGGDEFAVLLPHLSATADVELVARKITSALQRPFSIQSLPINVEARIGVASYPEHGTTADLLWQHADVALRKAKEAHRQYLLYSAGIDDHSPTKLALLGDLRGAIDHNELVLHYQPVIDLATGRAIGVEALLRWQHPERGLIFPDQFIPMVEHTGLIDPLTTWVIANALRQGHDWNKNGLPLHLSVNLSARNLHNPGLSTEIIDLARSSRFPLEQLTLEVTESAIMADPEWAEEMLGELHAAGIQISMDDFGIGQSSLAYLRDLPINRMKIDKSFVMEYRKPRNAAIVRSAIELAHNLGISVTAEGVEDRATCLALGELGCERGQGYYFSKPLPVERISAWLRESEWKAAAK